MAQPKLRPRLKRVQISLLSLLLLYMMKCCPSIHNETQKFEAGPASAGRTKWLPVRQTRHRLVQWSLVAVGLAREWRPQRRRTKRREETRKGEWQLGFGFGVLGGRPIGSSVARSFAALGTEPNRPIGLGRVQLLTGTPPITKPALEKSALLRQNFSSLLLLSILQLR